MRRSILVLIITLFLSFFLATQTLAQTVYRSNTVTTKVGSPTGPAPGSGQCNSTPSNPNDLRQSIIDQFSIHMNGFDQTHLQWAWQKFCEVSGTNLINLVGGTVVTAISGGGSQQTGCRTIDVGQYSPQELFDVVLIHELGHIIRNCNPAASSFYSQHLAAYQAEGGLTNYSRTACTYTNPGAWEHESEDYAEMITYYLNPTANQQTARCAGTGPNPYTAGGYPLHYNVAKSVLGAFP